jgi:hypothetical protein
MASLLFAPLISGGWCADADENGTSVCGSFQRSLFGFETNWWIWFGVIAAIVIATSVVARSVSRRS